MDGERRRLRQEVPGTPTRPLGIIDAKTKIAGRRDSVKRQRLEHSGLRQRRGLGKQQPAIAAVNVLEHADLSERY